MNQKHLDLLDDIDEDTIGLLGSRFTRLATRPKSGLPPKRERAGHNELMSKQHWVRPKLS